MVQDIAVLIEEVKCDREGAEGNEDEEYEAQLAAIAHEQPCDADKTADGEHDQPLRQRHRSLTHHLNQVLEPPRPLLLLWRAHQ